MAVPDGVGELPRLGTVGEFTLHAIRRSDLPVKAINEPAHETDEPEPEGTEAIPSEAGRKDDAIGKALAEIARTQESMAKLRLPLWLLVLVAVAILVLHN